jgi:CRP-like cAMP-binding protein
MPASRTNALLEALSPESRDQILSLAKEVPMPVRTGIQALEEPPRHIYFLTSGVASVVVGLVEGGSAETALIGREGLTGGYALMGRSNSPTECFMQVAGGGYRVELEHVRDLFRRSEEIRTRILQCVQQQALVTSQIAACNKLHDAEARLARWLLMVGDRTGEDSFQLTQEFIAQMLGTRRTTVALVAGTLQRSGFIEYTRGKVTIRSREHLATAACECYEVTRRLMTEMYAGT